jgi:hypothetical protein
VAFSYDQAGFVIGKISGIWRLVGFRRIVANYLESERSFLLFSRESLSENGLPTLRAGRRKTAGEICLPALQREESTLSLSEYLVLGRGHELDRLL